MAIGLFLLLGMILRRRPTCLAHEGGVETPLYQAFSITYAAAMEHPMTRLSVWSDSIFGVIFASIPSAANGTVTHLMDVVISLYYPVLSELI
jgi:hypothetical protein